MTAEFTFVAPTIDSNSPIRSKKRSVHRIAGSVLTTFERYSSHVATEWSRKLDDLTVYLRRR